MKQVTRCKLQDRGFTPLDPEGFSLRDRANKKGPPKLDKNPIPRRGDLTGFTLIETLIYAAITTIILTFAILSAYQIIDGSDRAEHQRQLAENQRFFEQKIYWLLRGVSIVNVPASGATGAVLSVNKLNFPDNPVVVDVDAGVIRLKRGAGAALAITDEAYVGARNISFRHLNLSGHSAIKVSGNLFDSLTSATVAIDMTVLIK